MFVFHDPMNADSAMADDLVRSAYSEYWIDAG